MIRTEAEIDRRIDQLQKRYFRVKKIIDLPEIEKRATARSILNDISILMEYKKDHFTDAAPPDP